MVRRESWSPLRSLYARRSWARIPAFWRIELEEGGLRIEAFRLRGRTYVSDGSAPRAGERLVVQRSFPLSFDPARLA